jgi:hypothetical protein
MDDDLNSYLGLNNHNTSIVNQSTNYHSHLFNTTSSLEFTISSPPKLHTFVVPPKVFLVSNNASEHNNIK